MTKYLSQFSSAAQSHVYLSCGDVSRADRFNTFSHCFHGKYRTTIFSQMDRPNYTKFWRKASSALLRYVLDFRHVAPFGNYGDRGRKLRPNLSRFDSRVKIRGGVGELSDSVHANRRRCSACFFIPICCYCETKVPQK